MEDSFIVQQQPPIDSQDPCPKQLLVYDVVKPMEYLVDPTLPLENEIDSTEVVELMQSSVDPTLPLESEMSTIFFFFTSSYFSDQGIILSMIRPPSP